MTNLTYPECISHIRANKDSFKLEAIAKKININPDQFRQIVNRRQYAKELPEKYRADFIKVVTELTSVRQVEQYEGDRTISNGIDKWFRKNEEGELEQIDSF